MRKLDQDSITPLYIQLMESIETEIISQRYSPGDRLPSEKEPVQHVQRKYYNRSQGGFKSH